MRLRSKYAINDLAAGFGIDPIVQMPVQGEDQTVISHRGWRCVVRPFSLGLVGLAIAVFLWGLAYKLSLYHSPQNNGGRTIVAKMWVGPRQNLVAPKSEKSSERPTSNPQLILILTGQSFPCTHTTAYAAAMLTIDSRSRHLLTALRSPPPQTIEVGL
jgi:hypothetical protein